MSSSLLRTLFACVLFLGTANATAVDFNSSKYDIYRGDINGDGLDDIYAHGKEQFLLLHSDIAVPLVLPPQASYRIDGESVTETEVVHTNCGHPQCDTYTQTVTRLLYTDNPVIVAPQLTQQQIAAHGLVLLREGTDYFLADFNRDGNTDILFRAAEIHKAYIYAGSGGGNPPTKFVEYTGEHADRINNRNISLSLHDANFDGYIDIVFPSSDSQLADTAILGGGDYKTIELIIDDDPALPATMVGSTNGAFRVDETGASNYSVAISLPKGVADVTPEVSLDYSSRSGNGIVGLGWTLNAYSMITRCRQTIVTDSNSLPLSLGTSDRFCMNGQPLVLDGSGAYGAPNTKYKTEIDSYMYIYAVGGSYGDPAYFEVVSKDGSLKTYGKTSGASRDLISNGIRKTLTWALDSSKDNLGNAIHYVYAGEEQNHRLTEINYANGSAKVTFDYTSTRPDVHHSYIAGDKITSSMRLNRIDVTNNNQVLRSYQLSYLKATPNNRVSRLNRIQECAAIRTNCLSALEFQWQNQAVAFSTSPQRYNLDSAHDNRYLADYKQADINGDGCQDLVIGWFDAGDSRYKTEIVMSDSTCNSYLMTTSTISSDHYSNLGTPGNQPQYQLNILDYNADGRHDIALRYRDSGSWSIHLAKPDNQGNWYVNALNPISTPSDVVGRHFIDINGDGLVDNVGEVAKFLKRNPAAADTSTTPYAFSGEKNLQNTDNIAYGDFNGDGNIDLVSFEAGSETDAVDNSQNCVEDASDGPGGFDCDDYETVGETTNTITVNVQTPTGIAPYATWTSFNRTCPANDSSCVPVYEPELIGSVFVTDFNGDGLDDIILKRSTTFALHLSTGNGFSGAISVPLNLHVLLSDLPDSVRVRNPVPSAVDYNHDGMNDLFWHDKVANELKVALWNGASATFETPMTIRERVLDNDQYGFLDVNGDSAEDLVRFVQTSNQLNSQKTIEVFLNQDASSHNVISVFKNNFGNETKVQYHSMSTSHHYSRLEVEGNSASQNNDCIASFPSLPGVLANSICRQRVANQNDFYREINNPLGLAANDPDYALPVFDLNTPMSIVASVESTAPIKNNINATSKVEYLYTEAKMQAGGRGFLGFKTLTSIDVQTGIKTTTEYHQNFPFVGMPKRTRVYTPEDELLSDAINKYTDQAPAGSVYHQPQLTRSTEIIYPTKTNLNHSDKLEVGTTALTTTITQSTYDNFGNVSSSSVNTQGVFNDPDSNGSSNLSQTTSTVNTYASSQTISLHGRSYSYAQLGRLTRVQSNGSRNNVAQEARTVAFTYYPNGMLHEEIIEPDSSDVSEKLTTKHHYDSFGNEVKTETTGWNGYTSETRLAEVQYDSNGRYSIESKDAYGHIIETIISRDKYGTPLQVENANGVITTFTYDALGREISRGDTSADNTVTSEYLTCSQVSPGCPTGAQYAMRSIVANGATTVEYFDRLGRTMRAATQDFQGSWVYVDTEYDLLGRIARVSEPYYFTAQYWTETTYDILSRSRTVSAPGFDGVTANSNISYDGLSMTTTNAIGQTKREIKNTFGELIKVEDNIHDAANDYAYIRYNYDTEGNLTKTTVYPTQGSPLVTDIHYDRLNRKQWMNDPDKGRWDYQYNAFGELIRQQDAKGQVVRNRYDRLGRLQKRTDYKNSAETQVENHTRWYFDGATDNASLSVANAIGQTTAVIMSKNTFHETCNAGTTQYCSYPTFDQYGRPSANTMHLNSDNNDATPLEVFNTGQTYDFAGRVDKTFDVLHNLVQDVNGQAIESGTQNFYNARGFLTHTQDLRNGDTLYRTRRTNERGQVTQADIGPYGRAMIYDNASGQLKQQVAYLGGIIYLGTTPDPLSIQHISYRWDLVGNLLSRHNQSSMRNSGNNSSNRNLQESFCYDSLNRLIKTNIGTTATSTCQGLSSSAQDLRYDSIGNIKYKNGVGSYSFHANRPHAVSSTGNGVSYSYDSNGNMTSDTSGRSLQYSTFDKPLTIGKGNHVSTFAYGPDRSRYLQIDSNSSVAAKNKTTIYLGNVERITQNDGTIEWRRQVAGGQRTYTTDASFKMIGDESKRFIFKDHLGSVDVIADDLGNLEQSMSFDPWGARRQENSTLELLTTTQLFNFSDDITSRGFTGHEMLDELGLIHMNGRIYDATIARFMQADPFIQAATDIQMYNRYSYLRNNPLNATDPSGYFLSRAWKKIRPFVGVAVGALISIYCQPCGAPIVKAAIAGAAGGFVGAAVYGRNPVRGAVIGGISGAAFGAVGEYFNGLGLENAKMLGKSGYIKFGGNVLKTSQAVAQIGSHAVLGGVMSVLQGGKFGHGFISSGFTKAVMGGANFDYSQGDALDIARRTLVAAIVGGTTSAITGGKFVNGARSAAIGHLLNQEASAAERKRIVQEEFKLVGEGARQLDKRVGFWRGIGKGFKSLGSGVVKAIGYGGSYWGSKVCSAWSSGCGATHQFIRDEGGRIGLALHDLTVDQVMTALVLSSASNTAEGYATGRVAGAFGLSKMPGPTYLKIGVGTVAVAGNMLQMSEIYGDALTGKHLVDAVVMGAQDDM